MLAFVEQQDFDLLKSSGLVTTGDVGALWGVEGADPKWLLDIAPIKVIICIFQKWDGACSTAAVVDCGWWCNLYLSENKNEKMLKNYPA